MQYMHGQYNMKTYYIFQHSICTGNFYSGAGITGRFSKVRELYKAWQPTFFLMTSDALSSGIKQYFKFQYTKILRLVFYNIKRRLLDHSSIPSALGCYHMRCAFIE